MKKTVTLPIVRPDDHIQLTEYLTQLASLTNKTNAKEWQGWKAYTIICTGVAAWMTEMEVYVADNKGEAVAADFNEVLNTPGGT